MYEPYDLLNVHLADYEIFDLLNVSNNNKLLSTRADKDGFVRIHVPGYNSESLEITVDNDRKLTLTSKDKKLTMKYTLGNSVDPAGIKASCRDGILKLYVPTKQPSVITIPITNE